MKKIILGFVLGLSVTSFAYVLMNPELPSMAGITDTTQIDLTKADEIISDPLQSGMNITAADMNAKFHSLNMKIAKLDCDNKSGVFTENDLSCLIPKNEIKSYKYGIRFGSGVFQVNEYSIYKEDFLNNSLGWNISSSIGLSSLQDGTVNTTSPSNTQVKIEFISNPLPTNQLNCEAIGGNWESDSFSGNVCSIKNLDEETCKINGFAYWKTFSSQQNALTVDTFSSPSVQECRNSFVFGYEDSNEDFMSEPSNLSRLDNYSEILDLYNSL